MWATLWILAIEALLGFALGSSLPPESKRHAECVPKATDTTGRSYTGYHSAPSVHAFLGIPFAQPPVGSLRWKPPKPLEHTPPGGQTLDATKFGKSCYQFQVTAFNRDPVIGEEFVRFTEVQTEQSEDCLTLNIWTPSRKKDKENLLPVLVWIYGGGHGEGGTSTPGFDGTKLVEAHQDVLLATFDYRLNIFGFPRTPSVPLNETNLGLLDQRAAIEWLRDNIAQFGGDPEKMTIFGQSSGAASTVTYMFSYPDDPIARGFIAQAPYDMGDGFPGEFARVAGKAGCGDAGSEEKVFECMMKLDGEHINLANSNKRFNPMTALSGGLPAVDNRTVWTAQGYAEQAMKGRFAKRPLLIGHNHQEGDLYLPWDNEKGINQTLSDIYTLTWYTCPTARYANMIANNSDAAVYRYRYMPTFPSTSAPFTWPRAYHGAEVSFIFQTFPPNTTLLDYEQRAADYLQGAWVAFAKDPENGLANYEGGWPKYDPTDMNKKTLVELFPGWVKDEKVPGHGQGEKVGLVRFVKNGEYEGQCSNPPRISWEDFIKPF